MLAAIGDPDGTRTVTSIIALLVAFGLALAMVAVWLHRTTRPDPELLAPLETMGERKWRRADPVAQRRALDGLRPDGARPLEPSVAPPTLDATFDEGPTAVGFDDLHGDAPHEVDADPPSADARFAGALVPPVAEATPRQIARPEAEEFSEDMDPELLAAAAAELDAELHRQPNDE